MPFKKGQKAWNKGIKRPLFSKTDERYKRICETCKKIYFLNPRYGVKYSVKTGRGRFCSDKCNRIHRIGIRVSIKTEFTKERVSGEKNHRWNGGKTTSYYGYVLKSAKNHPYKNSRGYVMEHRLIIEKILGRLLNKKEVVHHINHNKKDNNPINLLLFTNHSEHMKYEKRRI